MSPGHSDPKGVAGLKQQILHCLSNFSADAVAWAGNFDAAIYWASGEAFSEEQNLRTARLVRAEVLTFNLPESVRADMRLRFDPSDRETGPKTVTVKLESMLLFAAQDASGVDLMPALKRVGVMPAISVNSNRPADGVSLIRGTIPGSLLTWRRLDCLLTFALSGGVYPTGDLKSQSDAYRRCVD